MLWTPYLTDIACKILLMSTDPQAESMRSGEWVDIDDDDDDSDDEITFPNGDTQVHTENVTLDDTVPLAQVYQTTR